MSTGIGIFAGFALLIGAIALGGGMTAFVDVQSIMIVLGGTIAATLISFPMERVFRFISLAARLFQEKRSVELEDTIARSIELGHKAFQNSIFSLEKDSKEEENRYLRMGLRMLIQDAPASRIARRFAVEVDSVRVRHQEGIQLFSFMAKVAPSFGLIGTLIGLVNMLRGIGGDVKPETLGPAMALALITTLYGALLSFMLFSPAAEKLKAYSTQEQTIITAVRDAIIMIRDKQSSRELEEMLNSYLPPKRRRSVVEELMVSQVRSA